MELSLQIDASDATKISWTKVETLTQARLKSLDISQYLQAMHSVHLLQDNVKLDKEPRFTEVTYSDSGSYECSVTMGLLSRKTWFELVVEGKGLIETQKCWKMCILILLLRIM